MSRPRPGRSALILGPSGSGKSHLLLTALQHEGSGIGILALGLDELESYRPLYDQAEILATPEDVDRVVQRQDDGSWRIVTDKPFVLAAFDDVDFYPSLGQWDAKALESVVTFLRIVRAEQARHVAEKGEPRWKVLGLDTYSGLGELAYNAMLSSMRRTEPPKARGDGGAEFYMGYFGKLIEVSRACRAIRGYGAHWIATSHIQIKEATDSYSGQDVIAKEQHLPMFTGSFREKVPSFFDLVLFTGISTKAKHYAQWEPDKFKQSKSRYELDEGKMDAKRRIENDWRVISEAIL